MPATDQPDSGGRCPECGAHSAPGANHCWLCGRSLSAASSAPADDIIIATAVYEKSDTSTTRSVASLAVFFGCLGLIGLLAAFWNDIQSDSMLRMIALVIGAPALATMAAVVVLANRRRQITISPKTLTLGAVLGMIGTVLISLFAVAAVVVASIIALLVTCAFGKLDAVTHDFRYTLVMLAAIVVMSLLLRRWQAKLPLTWWQKLGLGIGGFCGAMIGAKLPFALSDWTGLVSGTAWLSDGKTIMLGIVGGYFGVELAKWTLDVRVKTGDTFAVPVAVGVAIGRLACFVGGCCYGTPTSLPWGVCFATSGDSLPRHPTQLYESAFHLTLAGLLFAFQQRGFFRGQLIKLYILAYLAYRFLTEFIRPEPRLFAGLTAYQWAALALVPIFVWLWWRDARKMRCANQVPSTQY